MSGTESTKSPANKPADQRTPNAPESSALDQETPLPSLAKQLGLDPHLLTPADILQLQRTIGNRATTHFLKNTNSQLPTEIIQRAILVQIEMNEEEKIDTIEASGHEEKGAHTTSYEVFKQSLRTAYYQQDFKGAMTNLWKLFQQILQLPAIKHPVSKTIASLVKNNAEQFQAEIEDLILEYEDHEKNGTNNAISKGVVQMSKLQLYGGKYLDLRNDVPGTVDKKRTSTNKGEAKASNSLKALEAGYIDQGSDTRYDDLTVREAAEQINILFDVPKVKDANEGGYYLAQHILSIISAYPSFYPLLDEITIEFIKLKAKDWELKSVDLQSAFNYYFT